MRFVERLQFAGGIWAVVTVDTSRLPLKARRINVTMPERVLEAVDRFVADAGETRSGLLVRAASEYMHRRRGRKAHGLGDE